MDKYKKYKEVRMGWLERIPAHWATVPLKYSIGKSPFSFVDGDWIESKVIESEGIRYLTTGNVGVINYKEQGNGFISEKTFRELNCTEVFPGDVLISRLNFPIGRACIVPDLGYKIVVAVDNVIFRPDETKYNKKFLVYQMNCYPYSENANFIARGSTMQRITRTQLGALKLCIPPLEEQNAMVTYLDKKCSEIDNVISAQQKRIALLQELKQSVITHAVTKGLDPNVEIKDSGVEWIGEVPSHWEIMAIKHLIDLLSDYDANGSFADISKNCNINNGNPYAWMVRTTDLVNKRYGIVDGNNYCDLKTYKYLKKSSLFPNDIIIAKRGDIGKVFLIPNMSIPMTLAPNTYLLKTKKGMVYNVFLFYVLSSECGQISLSLNNKSTTLGAIYKDDVKAISIPVPPLSEQKVIATYLDKKCTSIDSSISKAQHQVELLQEYKQSLITEVVTGKRKVS